MDSISQLILAHNADITAAWKMVLAHKVAAAAVLLLSSGTGASVFARLLNLIPMEPAFTFLRVTAGAVSAAGNVSVFRLLYQPLEDWFEKFIMGAAKAICEGLQLDSQVKTVSVEQIAPAVAAAAATAPAPLTPPQP